MIIKLPFTSYSLRIERDLIDAKQKHTKIKSVVFNKNYDKVFVIGLGKTGTTSLAKTLKLFGFTLGNQAVAEVLSEDWALRRDSNRIIRYCYTADAFQDLPFNLPDLYKELDQAFPNSKFILTVRDDPDQWFQSLIKFHAKKISADGITTPDEKDLKNALYRYKGFLLDAKKNFWGYPQVPLYDPHAYKKRYVDHMLSVEKYFSGRNMNFLKINIAKNDDLIRLCDFLQINTNLKKFPWENKT